MRPRVGSAARASFISVSRSVGSVLPRRLTESCPRSRWTPATAAASALRSTFGTDLSRPDVRSPTNPERPFPDCDVDLGTT